MPAIRWASFATALAISLVLMLFPFLLHRLPSARLHWGLPVMLAGVAGALVYGIGYRPDRTLLRILFGPVCVWLLMVGGALLLFTGAIE